MCITPTDIVKMSDYEQYLFPYLDTSKLQTLSCGHVIPPSNLLAAPILQAFNGTDFDFTFEGRKRESTVGLSNAFCSDFVDTFIDHQPWASDP